MSGYKLFPRSHNTNCHQLPLASPSSPSRLPSSLSPPPSSSLSIPLFFKMMLVQKQPTFNLTPLVHPHHRRNPSAPPVVQAVQPTKIPGMLSISRPQRTTPQRQMVSQQRQQQAPAPKTAPRQRTQISTKKPDPASPTPNTRGRVSKQPKDKKRYIVAIPC